MLFPTTLVGSYPQPDWLIDRTRLFVPRIRQRDLWRIDDEWLAAAQDDATRLAVYDEIAAGINIVTDGEIRRESYSNHLATALDGLDHDHPGEAPGRAGGTMAVPRVTGPITRRGPVEVDDVKFLRALTDLPIKITLPGPFTMAQQTQNEYYASARELTLAYASAVNAEIKDLFKAGANIVQLDEPFMEARADQARDFGLDALAVALDGVEGPIAIHLCFGYASLVRNRPAAYSFLEELADTRVDQISIETGQSNLDTEVLGRLGDKTVILGVLDLSTEEVETPEVVEARVERALAHVEPDRLILAPDCGMKFLSREAAFGKLKAMSTAARRLRERYGEAE